MATIYYPTAAAIRTRIVGSTGLTEMNIGISPNYVLMLTGSFPVSSSFVIVTAADTGSVFPITSSWSVNAVGGGSGSGGGTDVLQTQVFS